MGDCAPPSFRLSAEGLFQFREALAHGGQGLGGLVEAGAGAVRLRGGKLCFELDPAIAPAALANVGRRAAPLAKDETGRAETVIDRPRGVPRRIVENERED